ncbi:MAG: hypothetical protein ACE5WD_06725 [Candidatus Aminicenantia bacterium]
MIIQCKTCGHKQKFSRSYPFCTNCGARLEISLKKEVNYSKKGKNIQGIGILLFFFFVAVFFYYSRFLGVIGGVVSLLLWVVGKYLKRKKRAV